MKYDDLENFCQYNLDYNQIASYNTNMLIVLFNSMVAVVKDINHGKIQF
jgi:hypothetical protein